MTIESPCVSRSITRLEDPRHLRLVTSTQRALRRSPFVQFYFPLSGPILTGTTTPQGANFTSSVLPCILTETPGSRCDPLFTKKETLKRERRRSLYARASRQIHLFLGLVSSSGNSGESSRICTLCSGMRPEDLAGRQMGERPRFYQTEQRGCYPCKPFRFPVRWA